MRIAKLLFISLLAFAIMMPTSVLAKDTDKAGKITSVAGKSEVKKGGGSKKFNAFKGMAITKGDTIITSSDGKVTMELDSDKQVTIGTNTTLVISELVQSAKALEGKTSLSLLKGKVLITIKKKLDGDSRFEIETPTAIMGVMGTEFTVVYEEGESYVGVFEGAVKTKHGEKRKEETIVTPNEQLGLNDEGKGEKEKLDYLDLPLVGLEHYLTLLEKDAKADKALIERVKQQIVVKKQEEAADASKDNGSAPSNTKIVYEDTSGQTSGGGSVVVPTPPAPTETPVPTETPGPIEAPVPPLLDLRALYQGFQSFIGNDKAFNLPFTTSIAYNGPNSSFPADGSEVVKVEVLNIETQLFEERDIVKQVSLSHVSSKQLLVELSEPIEYGSRIRFTILANQLKNAETNDVQENDLVTGSEEYGQGFLFTFAQERYEMEFKHEDSMYDGEGIRSIELSSLGYSIPYDSETGTDIQIYKVCPKDEGGYEDEGCYSGFEYDLRQYVSSTSVIWPNRLVIAFNITNFQLLEPALYQVRVNLQDDRAQPHYVWVDINIVEKKPPVLFWDGAYTTDSSTIILPFTTKIASYVIPITKSNVSIHTVSEIPPALMEGNEDPAEGSDRALEIESVSINPNDATQLIVKLKNELEYGTTLLVTIAANSLMNPETRDVQKEDQLIYLTHRAILLTSEVEFIHQDSNQVNKEIMINTYGFEIGEPYLYRISEGSSEPLYELDGVYTLSGEGDVKTLTLLAEYFNSSDVRPGRYVLVIPVLDDLDWPTYLSLNIEVKIPVV
ncbi:FecR family protein [Paenibacillus sinopodophylli]|uniref:FecR family protein n=1 Tax=Paenibacillus sinopodophylli TaxID=1837342 RepID=UPI00110D1832|nr:FecR family protein [Paenibacillus sinopodophylli]